MYCPCVPHLRYHIADGFRELPGSAEGLTAKQIEALVDAGLDRYPTLKMLIEPDGVAGRGLTFRRYLAVHLNQANGVMKISAWKWRTSREIVRPISEDHVYYCGALANRKHLNPSLGRVEAVEWPNGAPRLVIRVDCRHCGETHTHSWEPDYLRRGCYSHRAAHCQSPTPYAARCGYYIATDPKLDRVNREAELLHERSRYFDPSNDFPPMPGARQSICCAVYV